MANQELPSLTTADFIAFLEIDPNPTVVIDRLCRVPAVFLHECVHKLSLVQARQQNARQKRQRLADLYAGMRVEKAAGDKTLTLEVMKNRTESDPEIISYSEQDEELDFRQDMRDYRIQALQLLHTSCRTLAENLLGEKLKS